MFRSEAKRPGAVYLLSILVFGPITYLAHELGHWGAGEAIGVDMWMTLNKAGPALGAYENDTQALIISMAGPLATLAIAVLAYVIARITRSFIAYGVLFFQFMQRTVAGGISLTGTYPNDEAAAGLMLGIGIYPITLAMIAVLFLMTWDTARRLKPGLAINVLSYGLCSLVITFFVMSDQILRNGGVQLL